MIKLLVVADDFTGALDTGVQFSKLGISTQVTTDPTQLFHQIDEGVEVVVVDTESRYLLPDQAYERISKLMTQAKKMEIPYFYKKVDSALRGNISYEIKALMDSFPERTWSFIPAYPDMKRTVKEGHLYIDGSLVSESVFADDPYEPVKESDIVKRIKDEVNLDSRNVKPGENISDQEKFLLFDGESRADLEKIAQQLGANSLLNTTIGCAGFAQVLASKIFTDRFAVEPVLESPLLVISGTVNDITRRQIEYSHQKGARRVSLSPEQLLAEDYWAENAGQDLLEEILKEPGLIIFETLSQDTKDRLARVGKDKGLSRDEIRFTIGQSLGQLAREILQTGTSKTILFTGGDTLYQSMKVLGVTSIRPQTELSSGVVLSQLDWQGRRLQVITKSGGFGQVDLFEDLQNRFQKNKECIC